MRNPTIAAVVPVFNPEPGLKGLCVSLLEAYGTVVVVDDGSCENTEDFQSLPEGINLVRHDVNKGKGRAIKTSIEWIQAYRPEVQTVVFVDGDGQHRPEDVAKVVAKSQETGNVVLGVRDFTESNIPFRSRFGNVLTSALVRRIYHIPIHDTQTGLRAIPRRLFGLMLNTPGERYEYEMRLFGMLDSEHERLEQVPIETIYLCNNRASHFHPVRDSIRVYRGLFGGRFFRFILSSLTGFVLDNVAFSLLLLSFLSVGVVRNNALLFALVLARVLSSFVNYQCNRLLVFGSTLRPHVSLGRYAILAVILAALSYGGTSALTWMFDADGLLITALKILVEVVLFLLSYRVQKSWVFQANDETAFNAMAVGKRLLNVCGPMLPFLLLLTIDISVMLYGRGWHVGWGDFDYVLRCVLLTVLPILALPLVLRRYARFVMPVLFVWMLIVDVIEVTAFNTFHMTVRGELIAILMGSSWSETAAFIRDFLSWRFFLAALGLLAVLVFGCRLLWRHPGSYPRRPLWSYLLALLLLLVGLKLGYSLRNDYSVRDALAFDVVIDSVEQINRNQNLAQAVKNPDLSDVVAPGRHVPVVVFVLGESATRDHWQLYGYPKETTPCLEARKDELIVFSDLLAAWAHTQEAVQLLTTRATLDDPNRIVATMPQVLTKAGYRCVLLSNQSQWGPWDSIVTLLLRGCSAQFFLNELDVPEEGGDENLLPFVERELAQAKDGRPLVLFLHLYGSHNPYRFRCNEKTAYFAAPERIDPKHVDMNNAVEYYDDTVRNTDRLLGRLLELLADRGGESVLIHLSDHGESPDDKDGKTRVLDNPSIWRVPFFVWCSPDYRTAYPERLQALEDVKGLPHQSDRLYDGILELANVKLKDREKDSFLSKDYDRTVKRRIENGKKVVEAGF